ALTAMRAAIVAGGMGTRAASMTADRIPKALLPVGGIPIIFRQLRILRREGVKRVCVFAGHLADRLQLPVEIEAAVPRLTIEFIGEHRAGGTAGCFTTIKPEIEDPLIVYGDILFDISLPPLRNFHHRQYALLSVVVHPNDHPRSSDLIVEDEGLVAKVIPRG